MGWCTIYDLCTEHLQDGAQASASTSTQHFEMEELIARSKTIGDTIDFKELSWAETHDEKDKHFGTREVSKHRRVNTSMCAISM